MSEAAALIAEVLGAHRIGPTYPTRGLRLSWTCHCGEGCQSDSIPLDAHRAHVAAEVAAAFAARAAAPVEAGLAERLHAQREWSLATFGPGQRLDGILAHIRKELKEVEDQPLDAEEWIDVVILAFDGAWRAGWEPEQIVAALDTKYRRNRGRTWPDWRTVPEGEPIEHIRPTATDQDTAESSGSDLEAEVACDE